MDTKRLAGFYNKFIQDERFNLQKIQVPEEKKNYIGFAELNNRNLALHAMYVEKDFNLARNYFFKAAVCGEYLVVKYDELLYTSIYKICYAILSDNSKVIDHYKELNSKTVDENFIGYYFISAIQSVLKNDFNFLQDLLKNFKVSVSDKKYSGFKGSVDVFDGLIKGDEIQIKRGIEDMLLNHGKRSEPALVKDYFSIETAALAKLTWRCGYKVQVNNKLVPNEILPLNELQNYDGYDFFNELYNV